MIIVFEGPDCCGKSTLLSAVASQLLSEGDTVNTLHMPVRLTGAYIPSHLRDGLDPFHAQLESLHQQQHIATMYSAFRQNAHRHLLLSRWFPSTYVYGMEDFCGHMPADAADELLTAMGDFSPAPDLGYVILPLLSEVMDRWRKRQAGKDIYEGSEEMVQRIYEGYAGLFSYVYSTPAWLRPYHVHLTTEQSTVEALTAEVMKMIDYQRGPLGHAI